MIKDLTSKLGEEKIIQPDKLSDWDLIDSSPMFMAFKLSGKELPKPKLVVKAESEYDIMVTIRWAYENNIPVVVRGGGSGVVGGALPVDGCIVLDVSELKWFELDEENMLVRVGAGVRGIDLERKLNKLGYTIRHYPQSLLESTVGGWIATLASGQYSTKYGNIEDVVLSLKIVLPDGSLIKIGGVPRKSEGPDIRRVFIGSEGIFGVIVEAELRILPLPEHEIYASYSLPSFHEGLAFVRKLMIKGIKPAVIRLYDRDDSILWFPDLEEVHGKNLLILIFEGERDIIEAEFKIAKKFLTKDSIDLNEEPVKYWLKERFKGRDDIKRYLSMGILFDTLDIIGLWSQLPLIYSELKSKLRKIKGIMHVSAHASHFYLNGGCLYFTVGGVEEDIRAFYKRIWQKTFEICKAIGCSASHHHGIGVLKREWFKNRLHEHAIISKIKETLDPKNIMNPGKLI